MGKKSTKSVNQLNSGPSGTFKINLCTTKHIPHESNKLHAKCLCYAKKDVHSRRTPSQKFAMSELEISDRDFKLHKKSHQCNITKWKISRKDPISNSFISWIQYILISQKVPIIHHNEFSNRERYLYFDILLNFKIYFQPNP